MSARSKSGKMGMANLGQLRESLRPDHGLRNVRLREAAALLDSGRFGAADALLREHLQAQPQDVSALRLLAETATRLGQHEDAETFLSQAVEHAPESAAARFAYAEVLHRNQKYEAALAEGDRLLEQEPHHPIFRIVRALALEALEENTGAVKIWRDLVEEYPGEAGFWLRYGHALRGVGKADDCIAAYRKTLKIDPALGRAYWALAGLKTYRFSDAEIAQMEAQFTSALPPEARTQLHFALGKAYAHEKYYEKSFAHYAKGNALHRLGTRHDPDILTRYVSRCKSLFTPEFFRRRQGYGCKSSEPIFLVGMLRAGSTLVEQILASHAQVEGTRELFEVGAVVKRLEAESATLVPDVLKDLNSGTCRELGEAYLQSVRVHRKSGRPFFIDKMGANFAHVGLFQLMLPNAKIVDVRRHPLACGLSIFFELFPAGHSFAYRLADIGRTYREYVELMAHFEHVLPGKVHRVVYEDLVEDPELEVRRLLEYLELPFEAACLEFYKADRVRTTASSEQVRKPIYRDALDQWRCYEPWLGPLEGALGPVLDVYPAVPAA